MSHSPQKTIGSRVYRDGWRAVNLLIRSDGSWSGRERDVCYRNRGDGKFDDTSFLTGLDSAGDGRAFATTDLNGDGALDLVLASRTAPRLQLLVNQPPAASSLVLELRADAVKTNYDAIGATATLQTNTRTLTRFVTAGAGYLSQSSRRLHFAFEKGEEPRSLTITWPNGGVQTLLRVPTSGTVRLTENSDVFDLIAAPTHDRLPQPPPPPSTWLAEPLPPPALTGLKPARRTLLNFWASWCPPCRQEITEWTAAASRFNSAGLQVVIASVDEDKAQKPAAPFALLRPSETEVAAWNLFHRHLFDRRQDIGLPTSFLLDEQGRVLKVYKGVTPAADILKDLAATARPAFPFPGRWFGAKPSRNYVELATALAEHGLPKESARYFDRAFAQGNAPIEAANNYAAVLLETGSLAKAETLLKQTLAQDPNQPDALANLGTLRLKQSQPEAAAETFRKVLALLPDDPFSHNGLGSALFAGNDLATARTHFEKAVAHDPENDDYRYNLASVLASSGNFALALQEFERILPRRPDSAQLAGNLGILYVETGNIAKGEAEFRRAIELAPQDPGGYLNLAMLHAKAGKPAEARRVLQQLLTRHPKHPQALQMLESMR